MWVAGDCRECIREYECSLKLVLFVIGRCTHLGMLNSICHLLDNVYSLIRSDWRMLVSVADGILRCMMCYQQGEKWGIKMLLFMSSMSSRKRTGLSLRTELSGTPHVKRVIRQGTVDRNSFFRCNDIP